MRSEKARRAEARLSKLKHDKKFLEDQLIIAADIQNYLLPKRIPRIEGYEMAAYYQPCSYVGGDYYDFIEIDEQHVGVLVADVAGKGFSGALVMTQVRTLMRSEAMRTLSPREVMIALNRFLYSEVPRGMFVTMLYVVVNIPRCVVTLASAGHNPMIHWNHPRQKMEWIKPGGLALAVDGGRRFEPSLEEAQVQLSPGDRLALYTDGVTETMDKKNQLYGDARLGEVFHDMLAADGHRFISALIESLNEFRGRAPQHDDITVVMLRRTAASPSSLGGFSYIEGERFVRCSGCGIVNLKEVGRCPNCRQPAVRTAIATHRSPAPGVTQCAVCNRIFPSDAWRDGCPYCTKRLCTVCGVRKAILGLYCELCAPKNIGR